MSQAPGSASSSASDYVLLNSDHPPRQPNHINPVSIIERKRRRHKASLLHISVVDGVPKFLGTLRQDSGSNEQSTSSSSNPLHPLAPRGKPTQSSIASIQGNLAQLALDAPVDTRQEDRIGIALIWANPEHSSPYVGFEVKMPIVSSGPESFFDTDQRRVVAHFVDFRFMAKCFDWRFRRISPDAKANLGQYTYVPDHGLLSIEFQIRKDRSVEIHGAPWPAGISPAHHDLLCKKPDGLIHRKFFKIITPDGPERFLHDVAYTLGNRGWIEPLLHLQPLGRPVIRWDVQYLTQRCSPNHQSSSGLPETWSKQYAFQTIGEYCLSAAFGQIYDTLYLIPQYELLRQTETPMRWIRNNEHGGRDEYLVSVHLDLNKFGILAQRGLREGDLLKICHAKKRTGIDPQTKKPFKDDKGWPAVVLPNRRPHQGTHWFLVQRPIVLVLSEGGKADSKGKSKRPIFRPDDTHIDCSYDYDPRLPPQNAFIQAEESLLTTKRRVSAVAECLGSVPAVAKRLSAEEAFELQELLRDEDSDLELDTEAAAPEKPTDCSLQRDIVLGRSILNRFCENMLTNIPQSLQRSISQRLTQRQNSLMPFLQRVPMGILPILGFAGSGKTTFVAFLILLFVAQGKSVSFSAPTNVATTNMAVRLCSIDENKLLIIRAYSSQLEEAAVLRYDSQFPEIWKEAPTGVWKGHENWEPEMSLAQWMLKAAGMIATSNSKILQIRSQFAELRQILSTPKNQQQTLPQELQSIALRPLVRLLGKAICMSADVILTTTTKSWDKPYIRPYTKKAEVVVIDEAAAAVPSEVHIPWRGRKWLILSGDPKQLPPACLSENVKEDGRKVNPFAERQKHSLLSRLQELGYPCLVLSEQLRIIPGGFDPASHVIYPDWNANYASNYSNHPMAPAFEAFARGLSSAIGPSPDRQLWPIHIDARNSVCLKAASSSKYNLKTARFTVDLLKNVLRTVGSLTQEDVVVITPYAAQLSTIGSTLDRESLGGVLVATADSFQGWEKRLVLFDAVVTKESGLGFVADWQRLCVSITRHTDFLVFILDSTAIRTPASERHMVKLLQWFKDKRRTMMQDLTNYREN